MLNGPCRDQLVKSEYRLALSTPWSMKYAACVCVCVCLKEKLKEGKTGTLVKKTLDTPELALKFLFR